MRDEAVDVEGALERWGKGHGVVVAPGVAEGGGAEGPEEGEVYACWEGGDVGLRGDEG